MTTLARWVMTRRSDSIALSVLALTLMQAGIGIIAVQRVHGQTPEVVIDRLAQRQQTIDARVTSLETMNLPARLAVLEKQADEFSQIKLLVYGVFATLIGSLVAQIVQIRGTEATTARGGRAVTDVEVKAAMSDRTALALDDVRRGARRQASGPEQRRGADRGGLRRAQPGAGLTPGSARSKRPTRAVCLAPRSSSPAGTSPAAPRTTRWWWPSPSGWCRACRCATCCWRRRSTSPTGSSPACCSTCTGGATAYFAPKAMVPAGRVPTWAEGKTARAIGDQFFVTV
jgi:hypothetical protein